MFNLNQIVAYPTDTSFGLGARVDDEKSLTRLMEIKKRSGDKFFSLMVANWDMLHYFAHIPKDLPSDYFTERPRTIILRPKSTLPSSPFWPNQSVAFRISTIPEVAHTIPFPITATSANISGQSPIFEIETLQKTLPPEIKIFPGFKSLPPAAPSEIWNYTVEPVVQIR